MGHCDGAASASAAGTAAVLTWPFAAAALLLHVQEPAFNGHTKTTSCNLPPLGRNQSPEVPPIAAPSSSTTYVLHTREANFHVRRRMQP